MVYNSLSIKELRARGCPRRRNSLILRELCGASEQEHKRNNSKPKQGYSGKGYEKVEE